MNYILFYEFILGFSIVIMVSCAFIMRVKNEAAINLRYALICASIASVANAFLLFSQSKALSTVLFDFYFSSIGLLCYNLSQYAAEYTGKARKKINPLFIIVIIDSLILWIGSIFDFSFTAIQCGYDIDTSFHRFSMKWPFAIHLAISYFLLSYYLYALIQASLKKKSFYKIKYVPDIVVLLLVVILNAIYMFSDSHLDWSVLLYWFAVIVVFLFSQIFIPHYITAKSSLLSLTEMQEGLITFDPNEECLYCNGFVGAYFDIDIRDINTKHPLIKEWTDNYELSELPDFKKDFTYKTKDSEKKYEVCFRQISSGYNFSLGYSFTIHDKTDEFLYFKSLNDARLEALAADKAKGDFLANMSHEIRTPINSILGLDELIIRESSEANIKSYAQDIQEASDTLLYLINQVLDFSKMDVNKLTLFEGDYEVNKLINSSVQLIAKRAEKKNIRLSVSIEDNVPKALWGDYSRIKQILVNLLTNAVKYTNEGSVSVIVRWLDNMVDNNSSGRLIISVKDTGVGISEENKAKLFDAFIRIEENKNRNIEGTGLGLTIVKQLIELMDGEIELDSELGEGSTFAVIIPQKVGTVQEHVIDSKNEAESLKNKITDKSRILIVDDVDMNRLVIAGLLKNYKVRIDEASDGMQALELIKHNIYDLVIMDVMMPVMDGVEALHAIRNMDNVNSHIPVIALTANAVAGAREEYLKQGFSDYLEKPVKGYLLERTVAKHLRINN